MLGLSRIAAWASQYRQVVLLVLALPLSLTSVAQPRPGEAVPVLQGTLPAGVTVRPIASGLEHPWSLAELPEGGWLVTERPGRLRHVDARGAISPPIQGLPRIDARGQGGLLEVSLAPDFATSRRLLLAYSEPADGGNSTAVMMARLEGAQGRYTLVDASRIFTQMPRFASSAHFGARIVWANNDEVWITLGDRFSRMEDAQTLDNHHGKVVRVRLDGSPSSANPKLPTGAKPEIWSWGHRNIQGAVRHPQTGELWLHEHGPQGGDELNIARAGRNYGWPVITYGERYGGGKIGEGTAKPGLEQPLHSWVPAIAPSGMAFYTSSAIPAWTGSLFLGGLRGQVLVRLELDGERVVREERLQGGLLRQRIRDVRQGSDGALYLLTDAADGQLLRVGR